MQDAVDRLDGNERNLRERLGTAIFDRSVRPALTGPPERLVPAAERINTVVWQCGLVGRLGLGTTRYDVLQTLRSWQDAALSQIHGDADAGATCVRALSFALGVGRLTPVCAAQR